MDLAIQITSTDKTVSSETVQNFKIFNLQSLATQAKKGQQLVPIISSIKKAFNLLGVDIVDLSTENNALKTNRVLR